jgi:hypothetical protein
MRRIVYKGENASLVELMTNFGKTAAPEYCFDHVLEEMIAWHDRIVSGAVVLCFQMDDKCTQCTVLFAHLAQVLLHTFLFTT